MDPKNPKIKDFFSFIYDRQLIWHKRFIIKQDPPWTDDHFLRTFCFCNTYRELDSGTIHIIDNIIDNPKYDLNEKIFNILLYRKFNTNYFFNYLSKISPYDYDANKIIKEMEFQLSKDIKLWKNAYMVAPPIHEGLEKKHVKMIKCFIPIAKEINAFVKAFLSMPNLSEAHAFLWDQIPGTGAFLAQQYLIDILYIKELRNKWEINSFVNVGPGARPAAKMLMPNNTSEETCFFLFEIQPLIFNDLKKEGKDWTKIFYKKSIMGGAYLRISDIQNCLCEFRKYCHLQTNPNKKKRYYKGVNHGSQKA